MYKKNKIKIDDENITENDIIKTLDDTKKHIPIQIRRVASGILKTRLNEYEKWEKESNTAIVHIEHLQEEIKEKNSEIQELKQTISILKDEIKLEKNKNSELIIKQNNFKNDISEILKIINNVKI